MCFVNAEEITLTLRGWMEIFSNGLPACYTGTDGLINIEAWLPLIAREKESAFRQWAMSRNAEIAQRFDSSRTTRIFPPLNAMLNNSNESI